MQMVVTGESAGHSGKGPESLLFSRYSHFSGRRVSCWGMVPAQAQMLKALQHAQLPIL